MRLSTPVELNPFLVRIYVNKDNDSGENNISRYVSFLKFGAFLIINSEKVTVIYVLNIIHTVCHLKTLSSSLHRKQTDS